MLALKVNEKYLDLSNDISITMKWSSPVFNTIGDHTYPFKIPTTPRNLLILGWKHRVENASDPYEQFDASLEWNNNLLLQGSLKIMKAQSGFYEATLYMNKGDFYYRRKNLSLQQVDLGELSFANENARILYINNCSKKFYPERNICFPMIFDELYLDPPSEDPQQKFINDYLDGIIYSVTSAEESKRVVIIPMLFFMHVLDKVFLKLEHTYEDLFFAKNPDFNSCVIYNSVDCNAGANELFLYPMNKILLNYHLPRISIYDFFNGLETFFNIRLFVDSKFKSIKIISLNDIIKSSDYIDNIKDVLSTSIELEEKIAGYKLEMTLDSDDTLFDDIGAYDETQISNVKDSVQTFVDLPVWPGAKESEIRFVIDRNCFYRMTSGAWVLFDINDITTYTKYLYKLIDGEKLTTKMSTLNDITHMNYVEIGNKRDSWEDAAFRIFFLKTLYDDDGYFSSMKGNSYTDEISLFYNGDKGLFNKQFKSFLDFRMSAKRVKIVANLDYKVLQELDFSRKYMIYGTKYLLSEVQVTITNDTIKPATITAFTCN